MNAPVSIPLSDDPLLQVDDALDELKRSRERMNAMLESIGDAFFAVDRDWRIIYANAKAASFVGVDLGGSIGRLLLEVAPALEGTALMAHYRKAMAGGQTVSVESCWEPSGTWIEVRAYPTADGLSVYFHDITEKRVAENALRERTALPQPVPAGRRQHPDCRPRAEHRGRQRPRLRPFRLHRG
jgi:PAS domain S-box-containing protein